MLTGSAMDCLRQQMEGTVCGRGFQNVLALCLRHDGNTIFCERIHSVIAYIYLSLITQWQHYQQWYQEKANDLKNWDWSGHGKSCPRCSPIGKWSSELKNFLPASRGPLVSFATECGLRTSWFQNSWRRLATKSLINTNPPHTSSTSAKPTVTKFPPLQSYSGALRIKHL